MKNFTERETLRGFLRSMDIRLTRVERRLNGFGGAVAVTKDSAPTAEDFASSEIPLGAVWVEARRHRWDGTQWTPTS